MDSFSPDAKHLERAIALAVENAESGRGGPFGAVIVDAANQVIAEGTNLVTSACDPTAHAEVTAIRRAAQALRTHDLSGCTVYSSCEPCPMCLGAILWSRAGRVVYAADQHQAAAAGFDDRNFYQEFLLPKERRSLAALHVPGENANLPFETWRRLAAKTAY